MMSIDERRVLGLIPARGGSKSIALKNMAPVGGRPLVAYVIEAAKSSRSLSEVACSTDHTGIAAFCRSQGITVIDRPDALGQDDTPVADVLRHVLEALESRDGLLPGFVALLQPTSPFVLPCHVDDCVAALRARPDADSAQTIAPVPHACHALNQRVVEDGIVRFRFLEERRQAYNKQRKPAHYTFGNVVVTRSASLLAGKDCFGDVSVPIKIARLYALDVDTAEDLEYAQCLMQSGALSGERLK
jgi:CMP-N-acetylneuraminic acid synthetase